MLIIIKMHKSLLLLPCAYYLCARSLKHYWLNNELRELYKDVLKPWNRRFEDSKCSDYRSLEDEFKGTNKEF